MTQDSSNSPGSLPSEPSSSDKKTLKPPADSNAPIAKAESAPVTLVERAAETVRTFRSYIIALAMCVGSAFGLHRALNEPPLYLTIGVIFAPLLFVSLCDLVRFWLKTSGPFAKSPSAPPDRYFRIDPWTSDPMDQSRFFRDDGLHRDVFNWVRRSKDTLLYLTGTSGSGKTSMINAYLIRELGRPEPGVMPVRCVISRTFGDPLATLKERLLVPKAIWDRPPTPDDAADVRDLISRAAAYLTNKGEHLLLIFDQFEELLILHEVDSDRFMKTVDLIVSLAKTPIENFRVLLVSRFEYIGLFDQFGFPTQRKGENWFDLAPFTIYYAKRFLIGAAMPESDADILVHQAEELEDTPGLTRPITLNMLGVVYFQDPDRSIRFIKRYGKRRNLLLDYLRYRIQAADLRDRAPPILHQMITTTGSRRPPCKMEDLLAATDLDHSAISAVLLRLQVEGFVRRISTGNMWEISQDFLASLLNRVLAQIEGSFLRVIRPWVKPVACFLWILVLSAFFFQQTLLERERERSAFHEIADAQEKDDAVVVTFYSLPTNARATTFIRYGVPAKKLELHLCGEHMDNPDTIGDTIFESVARLKHLDALHLSESRFDGSSIKHLRTNTSLAKLVLNGSSADDAAMEFVALLAGLTSLDIGNTAVSNMGLDETRISSRSLQALQRCTALRELSVNNTDVDDRTLASLAGMTKLTLLGLEGTKVTDDGLSNLKTLRNLSGLSLNKTSINGLGLEAFTSTDTLKLLALQNTKLTKEGVAVLGRLKSLETLSLVQAQVDGSWLDVLGALTKLSDLRLSKTKVDDADLAFVKTLSNVERLDLSVTSVGNPVIQHLVGLSKLKALYLGGTNVDNRCIGSLLKIKSLSTLDLAGTRVDQDGISQLLRERPKLNISRDNE